MQIFQSKWVWIGVLVTVAFLGGRLQDTWQWNTRALLFLEGKGESIPVKVSDCDHIWLVGAEAGKRGDISGQRRIWEHALGCSQNSISILRSFLPLDKDMALLATQKYPNSSESWSWLGEAIAPTNKIGARQAYLHIVALSPYDSLTWCRLGVSYEQDSEFEKAMEAYLNCCYFGDYGSSGCLGAGRMMEQLGDPRQAIEYYRLSTWPWALKRADELEKLLNP